MAKNYPYIALNFRIQKKPYLDNLLDDAGFLFGYGVFETVLIKNSAPIFLKEHFIRLKTAANQLEIKVHFNFAKLKKLINRLIAKNQVNWGRLNLYLTGGVKSTDKFRPYPSPNFIAIIREFDPRLLDLKINLTLARDRFARSILDSIKSLSYLKNIYAQKNLILGQDLLFFDENEDILETTTSNVFFIKGKTLITPNSNQILAGVMRDYIVKNCPSWGYKLEKRKSNLNELKDFDEIFLTNSMRGIILIDKISNFSGLKSGKIASNLKKLCPI